MEDKKLIANIWETPDGTRLWSRHVHDAIFYEDANGICYMVDGGTEYCHLSNNNEYPLKNRCIFDDEPWDIQRQFILRGTFDNNGNNVWVPLCKLSNGHIDSLIDYGSSISNSLLNTYLKEKKYRNENKIVIYDHDYAKEGVKSIEHLGKNGNNENRK